MMDWLTGIPAIEGVLARHFPDANSENLRHWAEEIFDEFQFSEKFEAMERAAIRPADDKANMIKIAKAIFKSARQTKELGQEAGLQLRELAEQKLNDHAPYSIRVGIMEAPGVIASLLEEIAEGYQAAAAKIDDATEVPLVFSDWEQGSKTKKSSLVKLAIAVKAKLAMMALSDRAVGRVNKLVADGSKTLTEPGGPYVDLVSDLFKALKVKGSADHYARLALAQPSSG